MKILKSYHIYPIFKINHLKEEYAAFKERVLTKLERMGLTDLERILYMKIFGRLRISNIIIVQIEEPYMV